MKSKVFLALSFALFIFVSGHFMFDGFGETWNKISTDDHYAWILKNSQLLDCADAKCRFIEDTKVHTKLDYVNLDYSRNLQRWREQHCLFDIYTPLYTVVMIGYKKIFNLSNWEQAYQAVSITGYIIACLGALVFLVSLFGYLPAAIAFAFMSLCKWGWLSFGVITPSFFVSGVMFWVLALFVRRPEVFLKLLGPIIVLTALYHPIGKVYAVGWLILAGVYFFEGLVRDNRTRGFFALAILCFLGVILIGTVEQPQFKLAAFPFADRHEILTHFVNNIKALLTVYSWFFFIPTNNQHVAGFVSVFLFLALIYLAGRSNKRNLIGLLLFFYTAISIFHMFRNYPGELSGRVMIPFFVYLCGAFGVIIVSLVRYSSKERIAAGVLIILFVFALGTRYLSPNEVFTIPPSQHFFTAKDNLYDPKQVQKLFDKDGNCGTVIYLDQTPMWVYSLYGSLKCGALVPYLWSLPNVEYDRIADSKKDLSHFVSFNPIFNAFGVPLIHPRRKFLFNFEITEAKNLILKLKASEEPSTVTLILGEGSNVVDRKLIEIKPNEETTLSLPVKKGQQLLLSAPGGPALVEKASFVETMNWPWNESVTISALDTDDNGKPYNRRDVNLLQWQTALEKFFKLDLGIVDDSKSSILMTAARRSE
ncbi:MAG: hypothetical protein K0R29_226 [Pseudobdellovibrio sp.]|jgi:hypothetical protein|nr:hypothetical protein [Pseudobdellovibrio sp.]